MNVQAASSSKSIRYIVGKYLQIFRDKMRCFLHSFSAIRTRLNKNRRQKLRIRHAVNVLQRDGVTRNWCDVAINEVARSLRLANTTRK